MVEDDVHDEAHAACARVRAEPGIERVVAEPGVHAVEIRDRVAVVRPARLVALEHRVEPELREAHARQVVESRTQSLEVAAVASVRVRAVHRLRETRDAVV